jgi:ZIP family zinc transporter/zinc and cadmium transporter
MNSAELLRTVLAAVLGLVAAAGNLLGGYFVVRKEWPRQYLQYFLALGSGYMLAVVFVEILPNPSASPARRLLLRSRRLLPDPSV